MLLGLIKIAFCLTIAAIVVETDYASGALAYVIGAVLVVGAVLLFNAGCRVAAAQEKRRMLKSLAGSIAPRLIRSDNPRSERSGQDRQTT